MGLRHVRFGDKRMMLMRYMQPVICRSLDHDITFCCVVAFFVIIEKVI